MKTETLERQLEALGELRHQRQQLQAREEELHNSLRAQMSEHGLRSIHSDNYRADLVAQERLAIDAGKFRRLVSAKRFLECVTVSVTAARKFVGGADLRRVSQVQEAVQLRVSDRQAPARAARKAPVTEEERV